MADVNNARVEMDRCDEPVLVATDIEDDDPLVAIDPFPEQKLNISEGTPIPSPGQFQPEVEWLSGVRVYGPELPKQLRRDNTHISIFAVCEVVKP